MSSIHKLKTFGNMLQPCCICTHCSALLKSTLTWHGLATIKEFHYVFFSVFVHTFNYPYYMWWNTTFFHYVSLVVFINFIKCFPVIYKLEMNFFLFFSVLLNYLVNSRNCCQYINFLNGSQSALIAKFRLLFCLAGQ